jgi:hypothetical protein
MTGTNSSEERGTKMHTCECGQPGTEVCYKRGSSREVWFCASRKHNARVRELSARGWLSQSATVAASATGTAVRRNLQANG